jgi:3-oxoacyl-[acyl-carrier protein] reductase
VKLEGKVALVTGAGSGIGRAIALLFAEEGAHIAVNDINLPAAEAVAGEVKQIGRRAIAVKANVAESADVDVMVARVINELGGVHILVNNAGIPPENAPTLDLHDVKQWDRIVAVNLRGTYLCSQRAAQWMALHKEGKIINISSVCGIAGFSQHASYGPAKAGIINLARSLAVEWAEYNININCIAPGFVMTPLIKQGIEIGAVNVEAVKKCVPFRRFAEPEEIAKAALFLASDDSSFITGVTIPVDGGFLAGGFQNV